MWTLFWDMHSGGRQKEPQQYICIEAEEDVARRVFYAKLGHNPARVTCTCCGEDYSASTGEDLAQLTGFHRGCHYDDKTGQYLEEAHPERTWERYWTLAEFCAAPDVLVIPASQITDEEREFELPDQGSVWQE